MLIWKAWTIQEEGSNLDFILTEVPLILKYYKYFSYHNF